MKAATVSATAVVSLSPQRSRRICCAPVSCSNLQVSHSPSLGHLDRSVLGFPTSMHSTTATYATLRKERRMKPTDQAALHRKSGGAEWRDLQFAFVDTRLLWLLRMAITEVDLAEEANRLHHEPPSKLQISPLRFAPVDITKGRGVTHLEACAGHPARAGYGSWV
jgi:hypothetical protein